MWLLYVFPLGDEFQERQGKARARGTNFKSGALVKNPNTLCQDKQGSVAWHGDGDIEIRREHKESCG